MKLTTYPYDVFQILEVEEELQVVSDLSELEFLIDGYVKQGKIYIAVGFSNASYIYSGAIAVLIKCFKKIRDVGGELCIIEPQKEINAIFNHLGIPRLITVCSSLEALPSALHYRTVSG